MDEFGPLQQGILSNPSVRISVALIQGVNTLPGVNFVYRRILPPTSHKISRLCPAKGTAQKLGSYRLTDFVQNVYRAHCY